MSTNPAQFALAQYLSQYSSAEEINEAQPPDAKKKVWLKKRNKVRPNDNVTLGIATSDVTGRMKNVGSEFHGLRDSGDITDGSMESESDQNVVRTRINVMDRNRLLLLQLEQSMKLPRNRLKPLEVNKSTKQDRENEKSCPNQPASRIGVKVKKNRTSKTRVDNKKSQREISRTEKGKDNDHFHEERNKNIVIKQSGKKEEKNGVVSDRTFNYRNVKPVTKKPPIAKFQHLKEGEDRSDVSNLSSAKSTDLSSNNKSLLPSEKDESQNRDICTISGDHMTTVLPKSTSAPKKVCSGSFGRSSQRGLTSSSSIKDELKISCMLLVILTSFVMCWAPIAIVNLVETIRDESVAPGMNQFSVFMMFFSSLINPVTYGLLNRKFRKEFSNVFCLHCPSETPSSHGVTEERAKRVFTL